MTDDEKRPPDFLAELDQLLRGLADIAKIVRTYYSALLEQGFTEAEAFQLTIAYQTGLQKGTSS